MAKKRTTTGRRKTARRKAPARPAAPPPAGGEAAGRLALRARYGFDFPDCVFAVWDLARRLQPGAPLGAFARGPLEISLDGPFDVLAGHAERLPPDQRLILHARRPLDVPELFSFAWGNCDGLHWGYFCDDPARGPSCVAGGYGSGYLEASGFTAVEWLRTAVEHQHQAHLDWLELPDAETDYHRRQLDALARLREQVQEYGTRDRPEVGSAYTRAHDAQRRRLARVVTTSSDGMGIVGPKARYRPLDDDDADLERRGEKGPGLKALVALAREALAEGFPLTALKVGKALWYVRHDGGAHGRRVGEAARDVLAAAYEALRRPLLAEVVRLQAPHRSTPAMIDVLRQDEGAKA